MRWLQIGLLALALGLTGCPKPTPQKTSAPGKTGATPTASAGPATSPGASPAAGGTPMGTPPPAWSTIPADLVADEDFYPMLKSTASWPDPAGLVAPNSVAKSKRPPPVKVRVLRELVELCVHKDYQPKDMDAALGLDGEGRLFARLGKGKASGSASLDTHPKDSRYPVFAMTFKLSSKGPHTLATLSKRVREVVNPGLMQEIERTKDSRFAASPRVKGTERVAALALLAPSGAFGTQFPYVYAYLSDDHLVVLLQEVPHMSAGPPK